MDADSLYICSFDIPHWDLQGDAIMTDKFIRLTPDRQAKRGALWNKERYIPETKAGVKTAPFEAHARFEVSGQGTKLFGDGMAIWLTKQRGGSGPVYGAPDGNVWQRQASL
jgi:lectin, mannose-binding 2